MKIRGRVREKNNLTNEKKKIARTSNNHLAAKHENKSRRKEEEELSRDKENEVPPSAHPSVSSAAGRP